MFKETLQPTEKNKQEACIFPKGTFIYPEITRGGVLKNSIKAERLLNLAEKSVKIKGYVGWKSIDPLVLYYAGFTWSLPPKSNFGAPPNKARKAK